MNFKPNLKKVFISTFVGVCSIFIFRNLDGGCRGIYCYYPFSFAYKYLWIFVIAIVYIVWSLFEINKKEK